VSVTSPERPRQKLPIDPRMRQRRAEVQRAAGRRRLRVLLGLAGGATVVAGAVGLGHTSLFGVHRLVVRGAADRRAAVVTAAAVHRGEPLLDVDPAAVEARIRRLPWIATVTVRRSWPGSLVVDVGVRMPVAALPLSSAAHGPVALVDETGRVIGTASTRPSGFPLLSGLGRPPSPGRWLDGRDGATGSALRLSAFLLRADVPVTSVGEAAGGLQAVVSGARVELGARPDVTADVAALEALAAGGGLHGGEQVDLSVPDRPAVSAVASGS